MALGRKNYLFVGSKAGGKAAAIAYTLIETAKLNAVDPHAWIADTVARILSGAPAPWFRLDVISGMPSCN